MLENHQFHFSTRTRARENSLYFLPRELSESSSNSGQPNATNPLPRQMFEDSTPTNPMLIIPLHVLADAR